ncbi:hypothetical protein FHS27_001639 [Rhodopirellula rubra]|uniref:Uncharacterized protein n=1 Tax=Aporhodopirellula rubra TaxID=980271 RepID=A0A7W5DWP7_9BACT|nr:hypothetical protein [Aporhodopirellula rubra]
MSGSPAGKSIFEFDGCSVVMFGSAILNAVCITVTGLCDVESLFEPSLILASIKKCRKHSAFDVCIGGYQNLNPRTQTGCTAIAP